MICGHWVIAGIAGSVVSTGSFGTAETIATQLTDGEITAQVNQKIALHDAGIASSILVITHDGVVTLIGRKRTLGDKLLLTRDATDTKGVVRVEDQLNLL